MSGFNTGPTRTFKAGADLSARQFCFVKLDSTQNQVVVATAGTDVIIGVLMNAPLSGDVAQVALLNSNGTISIQASTAISLGALVTATTNGQAVTTSTSGHHVAGVALEAATAQNDLIEIQLTNYKY